MYGFILKEGSLHYVFLQVLVYILSGSNPVEEWMFLSQTLQQKFRLTW